MRRRDPIPDDSTLTAMPRRALRPLAMLGLWLLAASAASAYTGGVVEWLNFPQITVAAEGDHYTGVTAIGYGWEGRVSIESEGLPRVKSWSLYPRVAVEGLAESLSFEPYKAGKSYPIGKRPQNVHRTVGTQFPNVFVNQFALDVCNLNLDLLMNQGYSRAQVLGQKRTIAADLWGDLDIDITVGDPIIEAFHRDIEIVCDKAPVHPPKPGPATVTTTGEFVLDSAGLVIVPGTYSGACPTDLTLLLTVEGNHKGKVEARVESTEGWKSTKMVVHTTEFDEASGLWQKEFSIPFTVPVKKPKHTGGGGGTIPSGPGGMQAPTLPGDDPFPGGAGGAGSHAVGGITAQDPGSNVHQQSLRLVAKANGKTVASDWDQYRVTCDPKPAIQPATTAFLPGGTGGDPPKPGDGDPKPDKPSHPGSKPDAPAPAPSGQGSQKPAQGKPTAATKAVVAASPSRAVVAQPDLRVVQARRDAKSPNTIEFLVANGGGAAAGKSSARLTCARSDGGAETWSAAVPPIPASGQQWVKTAPRKARPVRERVRGCQIQVDSGNAVREADEGNNAFTCADCAAGAKRRR
jgi:CARDB